MQLRMIVRRAAGAFTLLGDVAQATGPVAYGSWDDLLAAASGRRARRSPGASPCLPRAARDHGRLRFHSSSTSLRTWSRHSRIAQAPSRRASSPRTSPLATAYEEAARLADAEGLLAVIAPASLRGDPSEAPALFDDTRISVLTPREAKGMEFDHVIVVEPALIVEEAVGGQGLRELYVALTRPTTTLVVVHASRASARANGSAQPEQPPQDVREGSRRAGGTRARAECPAEPSRGTPSRPPALSPRGPRRSRCPSIENSSRPVSPREERGSRRAGTGAGGCPSSAGSSDGCARSSRR